MQTLSKLAFFVFAHKTKQPRFVGETKANLSSVLGPIQHRGKTLSSVKRDDQDFALHCESSFFVLRT